MTSKKRLDKLEQCLNPDPGRAYVMIDSQGVYWVNGIAYSEVEFNNQYHDQIIDAIRVGFDIKRI